MKKIIVSLLSLSVCLGTFIPASTYAAPLKIVNNKLSSVYDLQVSLRELGYNLTTDGEWGPQTLIQLSKFQKDNGLPVTQEADFQTITMINELLPEVPVETVNSNLPSLKVGSKGESVKEVQRNLKKMGYGITVDGAYGTNTANIVMKYQRSVGLSPTGIADAKTQTQLASDAKSAKVQYSDLKTVKNAPTKGYWLAINKTTNRLNLFKGTTWVKTYPIATGKTKTLTPEGKFKIIVKAVNPSWGGNGHAKPIKGGDPKNPLGKRWLGLDIGGGGQYGVHGNSNPDSIGTYASAGCVRMYNEDVVELYDMLPTKTPVWMGTEKQLNKWGVE